MVRAKDANIQGLYQNLYNWYAAQHLKILLARINISGALILMVLQHILQSSLEPNQ